MTNFDTQDDLWYHGVVSHSKIRFGKIIIQNMMDTCSTCSAEPCTCAAPAAPAEGGDMPAAPAPEAPAEGGDAAPAEGGDAPAAE